VTGGGVERLQPSIIKDEQIGAPERAQNARVAPVAARQGEIFEKLGHAVVEHRPIVTAGFVAERRRQLLPTPVGPTSAKLSWASIHSPPASFWKSARSRPRGLR
jgi:hypothetical protein